MKLNKTILLVIAFLAITIAAEKIDELRKMSLKSKSGIIEFKTDADYNNYVE